MIRLLVIILLLFTTSSLRSQPVKNDALNVEVEKILGQYSKYLSKGGFDRHHLQHLLLRFDTLYGHNRIFIGAVSRLGYFRADLPQYWTKVKGRFVFVYVERGIVNFDSAAFALFHDQFSAFLEQDVSRNGIERSAGDWWMEDVQGWMVNLEKEMAHPRIITVHFPAASFYEEFDYDYSGYRVYHDGVLDGSSMGINGPVGPSGMSPTEYILTHTDIPKDSLSFFGKNGRNKNVTALVEISAIGKVTSASVNGIFDSPTRQKAEQALRDMPPWKPARLNGKSVIVRIRISI